MRSRTPVMLASVAATGVVAMTIMLVLSPPGVSQAPDTSSRVFSETSPAFEREYAITAEPFEGDMSGLIGSADALEEARAVIGMTEKVAAGEPTLVAFADADYGEDTDQDGAGLRPYYTGQPAWLVTFEGTEMPIFGPAGYEGSPSYTTTLMVFIDAHSGKLIEAVTIS